MGRPRRRQPVSISGQLFKIYAVVTLLLFAAGLAIVMPTAFHWIREDVLETQKQVSQTMTQAVAGYFSDMDRFSKQLMQSQAFRQAVLEDIPEAVLTGKPYTQAINTACREAYQMYEYGYKIGVISREQVYLWMGDQILAGPMEEPVARYADYDGSGLPVLYLTQGNETIKSIDDGQTGADSGEPMLVLARSLEPGSGSDCSRPMLELFVDQSSFAEYMENLVGSSDLKDMEITLFNSAGQVLYGRQQIPKIPLNSWDQWNHTNSHTVRMSSVLYSGVFVYYQIPDAIYLRRMLPLALSFGLLLILMLGSLLLTSHFISRRITGPISRLSEELQHLSLTEPVEQESLQTNLQELTQIQQVVAEMQKNLAASMQENVVARTSELQSRLMALQSQMEPHFLYNTLAAIAGLSEQEKQEAVSAVCLNLSRMLRYVSSREEQGVTLYNEVAFLRSYIGIMQERFPGARVHIRIPMEMMLLRVPKLILQPLCENAFKHCDRSDVEIWVTGEQRESRWQVTIRDNGPGFAPDRIKEILERCSRVFRGQDVLSEEVEGLGLVNIYARLALFYQNDFIFELDPIEGITIGGTAVAKKTDRPGGGGRGNYPPQSGTEN